MGILLLALMRCESEDECQAIADEFQKAATIEWCSDKKRPTR
jgi:hypothetical protein